MLLLKAERMRKSMALEILSLEKIAFSPDLRILPSQLFKIWHGFSLTYFCAHLRALVKMVACSHVARVNTISIIKRGTKSKVIMEVETSHTYIGTLT